jgi:hypothetical protein
MTRKENEQFAKRVLHYYEKRSGAGQEEDGSPLREGRQAPGINLQSFGKV